MAIGAKAAASSAVLVASYLVVHAPIGTHAAPSPLRTQAPSSSSTAMRAAKREDRSADTMILGGKSVSGDDVDDSIDDWGQGASDDINFSITSILQPQPHQFAEQYSSPTQTFSTNGRRDSLAVNASARSIAVPASFTSSLANAWDPGRRSVWFQRKAVIITSIFLAIFIVLIIGATVFLRDKRDEDLEKEYDVSDEAALARMREEREMRLGSRGEKKGRRRRKKDEASSSSREDSGLSTAIVASKWARLPTRKIRIRKKCSNRSSATDEPGTATTPVESARDNEQSSVSLSGVDSNDANLARQSLAPPLAPAMEQQDSDNVSPSEAGHPSTLGSTEASDASRSTGRLRVPLSAADLEFAEEEERMRYSEALPPAYIPSQRTSSTAQAPLHPTASRQLAGHDGDAVAEARGDTKRPIHDSSGRDHLDTPSQPDQNAISGPSSSDAQQNTHPEGLEAHIATDDKTLLSRMREAASYPASSPMYVPSAPSDAPGSAAPSSSFVATAPDMDDADDASFEHLNSKDEPSSLAKGKGTPAHTSSRLPTPPEPSQQVAFSRFDLPYQHDQLPSIGAERSASVANGDLQASHSSAKAQQKAREAAEEHQQAMAVMESRPDDLQSSLPRYEREQSVEPSAPPPLDQDEEEEQDGSSPLVNPQLLDITPAPLPLMPSAPTEQDTSPSAPPAPDDEHTQRLS